MRVSVKFNSKMATSTVASPKTESSTARVAWTLTMVTSTKETGKKANLTARALSTKKLIKLFMTDSGPKTFKREKANTPGTSVKKNMKVTGSRAKELARVDGKTQVAICIRENL